MGWAKSKRGGSKRGGSRGKYGEKEWNSSNHAPLGVRRVYDDYDDQGSDRGAVKPSSGGMLARGVASGSGLPPGELPFGELREDPCAQVWQIAEDLFYGDSEVVTKVDRFIRRGYPSAMKTFKDAPEASLPQVTKRVEAFVKIWIEDALGRCWQCFQDPERLSGKQAIDVFTTICQRSCILESDGGRCPPWAMPSSSSLIYEACRTTYKTYFPGTPWNGPEARDFRQGPRPSSGKGDYRESTRRQRDYSEPRGGAKRHKGDGKAEPGWPDRRPESRTAEWSYSPMRERDEPRPTRRHRSPKGGGKAGGKSDGSRGYSESQRTMPYPSGRSSNHRSGRDYRSMRSRSRSSQSHSWRYPGPAGHSPASGARSHRDDGRYGDTMREGREMRDSRNARPDRRGADRRRSPCSRSRPAGRSPLPVEAPPASSSDGVKRQPVKEEEAPPPPAARPASPAAEQQPAQPPARPDKEDEFEDEEEFEEEEELEIETAVKAETTEEQKAEAEEKAAVEAKDIDDGEDDDEELTVATLQKALQFLAGAGVHAPSGVWGCASAEACTGIAGEQLYRLSSEFGEASQPSGPAKGGHVGYTYCKRCCSELKKEYPALQTAELTAVKAAPTPAKGVSTPSKKDETPTASTPKAKSPKLVA
eukprot:gnl/TRDRNA2_/TRDRNA2_35993_c0_seq1.p1 gnl/TRDRNA2_/TRDRNA2_35993_c0~~gnl/TRDRNA2_/TRDRNA2_35993_c0_seq1.p1  ORF type:complete len:645 (-),score=119.85 gnl/TRDRNA2_/TRDRNA2_35993_c0_seq1:51-1985(-)